MKKVFLLMLTAAAFTASAVTLEKGKDWVVRNSYYTLRLEKNHGYAARLIMLNGKKIPYGMVTPAVFLNGERPKWDGQYSENGDTRISRAALKVTPEAVTVSPDKIVLRLSYPFPCGKIVEQMTFDDTSLIRYDVTLNHTGRLGSFRLNSQLNWHNSRGVLFYPDRKMVRGVWHSHGNAVEGAAWRYVWYGKDRIGLGMIAPEQKALAGLEYSLMRKQDGWSSNCADMGIFFAPLGQYGTKGKFKFSFYLIAGGDPKTAEKLAESILGKENKVGFFTYETEKLVIRPGQDNSILGELRNSTGKKADLKVKTVINYGLDTEKTVDVRKVSLKAGEIRAMKIPVRFPAEAQRGVAIRTDVTDASGKLLDRKLDFCSITNYAPRDAGFGIINVGQACQHGAQDTWNQILKDNYVGAYEYYCWAPSVIFGLAPSYETWIPQTEHNFRSRISRTFLKTLVNNAHSKGVGVYAWITGLWSYKEALQRPEWVQFTQNGQPNIYSGRVYPDGSRRVVVKANMFYPDRAEIWGKEMADSVDMFGWDGCRWDWGFVPSLPSDPLFQNAIADDWYDWRGRPSSKLFPDPDKTGVECLKAWRKAVETRHPNFVFGTNYGSSDEAWKNSPGYHKLAATNALVLFEDMLGFRYEKWNTFEKWGDELARRCDRVRPYNAAPVVGAMSGLPQNSVSYQLANYTCASAGVKWWAYATKTLLSGTPQRNRFFLRFAEYYFDTAFRRPAKCPVELTAPAKVLFKPFVRERKTAEGREVVVPFVNQPEENGHICEFHLKPPVRKFSCRLALKPGETATAWFMNPNAPEKAFKLDVKDGTVTVPELEYGAMVRFQCRGGK